MTSAGNNLTRFTKVSKAQSLDVRFLKKSRASFCSDDGIALAMKESTECCSKSACENARNTRHKYCASVVFSSCDISVSWSLAKASSACIGPPKYCECIVTLVSASVTLSKACATSLQRVALSSHALPALLDDAPRVRSNVSFKAFKDVIALRPSLLFIASGTLSASAFAASSIARTVDSGKFFDMSSRTPTRCVRCRVYRISFSYGDSAGIRISDGNRSCASRTSSTAFATSASRVRPDLLHARNAFATACSAS